jgi:hypothetical protein
MSVLEVFGDNCFDSGLYIVAICGVVSSRIYGGFNRLGHFETDGGLDRLFKIKIVDGALNRPPYSFLKSRIVYEVTGDKFIQIWHGISPEKRSPRATGRIVSSKPHLGSLGAWNKKTADAFRLLDRFSIAPFRLCVNEVTYGRLL